MDLNGVTRRVGRLFVNSARGRDTAAFEYSTDWLEAPYHFALAPALEISEGLHYTTANHALFGALSDSAPDRWGQTLMRRAERRRAKAAGTTPRALREIDFLLGVSDTARPGAIRFSLSEDGPFVAEENSQAVPPLIELPRLLAATTRYLVDDESAADLSMLLAPGSSLGGARPKASIRDVSGNLLIAKFPKPDDDHRVVAWEAVALELARRAGVDVADSRLDRSAGGDVLLLKRFDRRGGNRVPFLSAMSMLNAFDGDARSYREIADAIRRHGAAARSDLHELWRRIVFTVLISNTDDHLRNHGFLYEDTAGWRLSPAYDLNPVPADISPRVLSTSIGSDGDPAASLDIAMEEAAAFDLPSKQARLVANEVGTAVSSWRAVASELNIAAGEIERMQSAFEHEDLRATLRQ
jgi:serine/threonine-protein kinase HipA